MCPAPWTRTLQGQNWSLLFWSKGFFFFIVDCIMMQKNFMTSCWAMINFVFPADRSMCDIWMGRLQGEREQVEHWISGDRNQDWADAIKWDEDENQDYYEKIISKLQGEWEQVEHWIGGDCGDLGDRGNCDVRGDQNEWWWLRLRLGWGSVWWRLS